MDEINGELMPVSNDMISLQSNVDDLSMMSREKSRDVISARIEILNTLRRASIKITNPEDWLLFRSPDGRVTAYLQDCGCERIRPLWGIDITPTNTDRIGMDDGQFLYVITGNGLSHVTKKTAIGIEGSRSSTDDFISGKLGAQRELAVRKAARANLDGSIVRELTGLSIVPIEELQDAWNNTNKKTDNCRLGRGFGSQTERHGAVKTAGEYGEAPKCPGCGSTMKFFAGRDGREPFWGCPDYKSCGTKPITAKKRPITNSQEAGSANAPEQSNESNGGGNAAKKTASKVGIGDVKNELLQKIKFMTEVDKKEFYASIASAKDMDALYVIGNAIDERLKAMDEGSLF